MPFSAKACLGTPCCGRATGGDGVRSVHHIDHDHARRRMKTKLTRQQLSAVGVAVFGLVLGLGSYMILVAPQKSKAVALAGAVDAAQSSLYVLQHHHVHVQKPKPPAVEAADLFRLTKAMPDSP